MKSESIKQALSQSGLLDGKTILLTGAAGIIGHIFAEAIVVAGGNVVLADVDEKGCQTIAATLDGIVAGRNIICAMDMTKPADVDNALAAARTAFGGLDGLVNNAYNRGDKVLYDFYDFDYEQFSSNVGKNLGGAFLVAQTIGRYFQEQGKGSIVNIASIYGNVAPRFDIYDGTSMTTPVDYAVIKAGVLHLTRYMANYFKKNIRVNSISPGGILTSQPDSFLQNYRKHCINKGMLDADDLCGALVYLLSDLSAMVNGQNIAVDDGFTL